MSGPRQQHEGDHGAGAAARTHSTQQAAEAATPAGSSAEARLNAIKSQQPKQTWQRPAVLVQQVLKLSAPPGRQLQGPQPTVPQKQPLQQVPQPQQQRQPKQMAQQLEQPQPQQQQLFQQPKQMAQLLEQPQPPQLELPTLQKQQPKQTTQQPKQAAQQLCKEQPRQQQLKQTLPLQQLQPPQQQWQPRDVRPGDSGWDTCINSIRRNWASGFDMPVFDERLEARIERVRICYRLSGRNKGTVYRLVKVVGANGWCRSVPEVQKQISQQLAAERAGHIVRMNAPIAHDFKNTDGTTAGDVTDVQVDEGKRVAVAADIRTAPAPKRMKVDAKPCMRASMIPVRQLDYLLKRLRQAANREASPAACSAEPIPGPVASNVGDGVVSSAGASCLYADGVYPFSDAGRCSARLAGCQGGSRAADGAVGGGGSMQQTDTLLSDDSQALSAVDCGQEGDNNAVDWEAENKRLRRELHAVTQQRDAALVLAQQLHHQMLGGSEIFGLLSLSGDV